MERKEFLQKMLATGLTCGCALSIQAAPFGSAATQKDLKSNQKLPETPCAEKIEFTKTWVKRFMEVLDGNLDEETRKKIMMNNGRECAKGAYGEKPEATKPLSIEDLDARIAEWQKIIGKENIHREGKVVYFNYVQNPGGLKISDGYCLCPMIEDGPVRLSPTYCYCSVGYVKYMFRVFFELEVSVELLESLRSGGKSCRFRINV